MGIYAVVQHDIIENVIILNAGQVPEFETEFGVELVDAIPYGLCIGDLRVGGNWTRNLNGEQVVLQPITPEQQTDYAGLRDEMEGLTAILTAAEEALIEGVESIG